MEVRWPVRVLVSNEDEAILAHLKEQLIKHLRSELGTEIEVVAVVSAQETLKEATDKVFDLIIINGSYAGATSAVQLVASIKRLDRTIPVFVLSHSAYSPIPLIDGWYQLPLFLADIRSLAAYLQHPRRADERAVNS